MICYLFMIVYSRCSRCRRPAIWLTWMVYPTRATCWAFAGGEIIQSLNPRVCFAESRTTCLASVGQGTIQSHTECTQRRDLVGLSKLYIKTILFLVIYYDENETRFDCIVLMLLLNHFRQSQARCPRIDQSGRKDSFDPSVSGLGEGI